MDAEVVDALASIDKRLARLDLIESHLLDLLLPQRKAFMRSPQAEPPTVVADGVEQLLGHTAAIQEKLDALAVAVADGAPKTPATASWEQAAAEVDTVPAVIPPAAEAPPSA